MNALKWAKSKGACGDAVDWLATQPGMTLADAWEQCTRSDWMLWALDEAALCSDDPQLHEFACRVAETALETAGDPDPRSIEVIRVKRLWLAGDATDEDLAAARAAAQSAWSAWSTWSAGPDGSAIGLAAESAWAAASIASARSAASIVARSTTWSGAGGAAQADLLRELIGNPFNQEASHDNATE